VVVSDRALKEGQLEVQGRRETEASKVDLADVSAFVKARLTT
jgi:prolyl-tRNA synthetase